MIDISNIENVHFIGIGGTGMNGLAQLALLNNFNVSGSDRKYDPLLSPFKELEKMGIKSSKELREVGTIKDSPENFKKLPQVDQKEIFEQD